jgi:hypothetical protein
MGSIRRRGVPIAAVVAGALVLPTGALGAVTKPGATTGGATSITQTTVVLHGTVDPNGASTTYFFQAGTTKIYGGQTTTTSAGSGTKAVTVKAVGTGFAPSTTYHYRLVAQNRKGLTVGKDRTFKTKRQPLGVSLSATPNPIRSGRATTLAGVLSGTGNANRQVVLQANVWPYTGGFVNQANPQVTNSTGAFSFPILSVTSNTQYRVLMVARPDVVSPIVVLGTTIKVSRHAKVFPGTNRGRIHFWGRLTPAIDGATVQIQKLREGNWITIAQTTAKHSSKGFSRYSKRVKQKHGGRYRVVAIDPSGVHSTSTSRSIRRHHLRG